MTSRQRARQRTVQQVIPPIQTGWRLRIIFGLSLIMLFVLSLSYLRLTGDLASTGYDVAELDREKGQWQARNEQAALDVARLESLDRVAKVATERLKMGPAQREMYVKASTIVVPPAPTAIATPSPADDSILGSSLRQLLGAP